MNEVYKQTQVDMTDKLQVWNSGMSDNFLKVRNSKMSENFFSLTAIKKVSTTYPPA